MRGMLLNAVRKGETNAVEPVVAVEDDGGGDAEYDRQCEGDHDLEHGGAEIRQDLPVLEQVPQRLRDAGGRRNEGSVGKAGGDGALPGGEDCGEKQHPRREDGAAAR